MESNTYTFSKRMKSLLKLDLRRLFTSLFFYIILGSCLVAPILIVVMTTIMDGTVQVDPNTGQETTIEKYDSVWEILGKGNKQEEQNTQTHEEITSQAGIDIMDFCNIDLLIFGFVVLVAMFISSEFRSGYVKNIFTMRSKSSDYVISKLITCVLGCILMVISFIVGGIIGGAVSNISFSIDVLNIQTLNLLMCIICKLLLPLILVPIYLLVALLAKQRLWLSLVLAMASNMLFFMMIPMLSPLTSTYINVLICLGVGVISCILFGLVSNIILKKTSIL